MVRLPVSMMYLYLLDMARNNKAKPQSVKISVGINMCINIRIESKSSLCREIEHTLLSEQFFHKITDGFSTIILAEPKRDCNGDLLHYDQGKK